MAVQFLQTELALLHGVHIDRVEVVHGMGGL